MAVKTSDRSCDAANCTAVSNNRRLCYVNYPCWSFEYTLS